MTMSSSRPFFTKAADFAHRATIVGLLSFFGFQIYQVGKFVYERQVDSPYMHSTYQQDVAEKVKEEYKEDNVIDGRNQRDTLSGRHTDRQSRGHHRPRPQHTPRGVPHRGRGHAQKRQAPAALQYQHAHEKLP